ncbi:helix-turn-helix domain-containing protein [Nocardiopsis prasina]|uniref:helix-turn-helix domain-containing protein n=1 Tax=Nocardiopsis prasina TaxID=2015 RepID=UPI00034BFDCE|nr:helix-turn-helix transcriptional regulator [Nocardiopsis prasina]
MPVDGTPDPYEVDIPFGTRLKLNRTRRGLTREVLGGLVGRSASWVKALETGRLSTPRLPVLLSLVEVLHLRDLAELTGKQSVPVALFSGPGHTLLPRVRASVNSLALGDDRPVPTVERLRARLAGAWRARHSAPNHRDVVGRLLPGLFDDAQRAVRGAENGTDRRAANSVLSEVCSLAQFFIAYQPAQSLLWRVAERGMVAAQEAEDPHALGVAAWLLAQAHRDAGDWEAADAVTEEASRHLERHLPDADLDVLAVWGALRFEAGYTAARRGEAGTAWRHWDTARKAAERLPASYYHPMTSFSRPVIGAHAVTVAVELRSGHEAVRQSGRAPAEAIPSRPRGARHRIEQARAHRLAGQRDEALRVLEAAHAAAPETVRYNAFARHMVLEELESRDPRRRDGAGVLAERIGLLS